MKGEYSERDVYSAVKSIYDDFKMARTTKEDEWLNCWAEYMTSDEAMQHVRDRTLEIVGQVNNSWRHRFNLGKGFEGVEQIFSYFMQAMFPSTNWFDVVPREPGFGEHAKAFKRLISHDIENSNFYLQWADFLRQLVVCGTSHILVRWCEDEQMNKFECLDVFDCFIDPESTDPNEGNFIRRFEFTKLELYKKIEEGYYGNDYFNQMTSIDLLNRIAPFDIDKTYEKDEILNFNGISIIEPYKKIELLEFWGTLDLDECYLENQIITICGGCVMRMEKNTYDKRPIITGNYIKVIRQPYGLSALSVNLGTIAAQNGLVNQRADGIEVTINPMFTVRENGTTTAQDVFCEPGRTFPVENHDDIRPIPMETGNLQIGYQEVGYLESVIDRNFGTVPGVGLGQQRQAERVTAFEIETRRNAGGSRLLTIHTQIEKHSLQGVLWQIVLNYKKFFKKKKIIRIAGEQAGQYLYYEVDSSIKDIRYYITPMGAQSIIDRQAVVERYTSFVGFVAQLPPLAERVDWDALLIEILQKWGFDEPEKFLAKPKEATPQEAAGQEVEDIGGKGMKNAVDAQMMADGGNAMMQSLMEALQGKTPVLGELPESTAEVSQPPVS